MLGQFVKDLVFRIKKYFTELKDRELKVTQ